MAAEEGNGLPEKPFTSESHQRTEASYLGSSGSCAAGSRSENLPATGSVDSASEATTTRTLPLWDAPTADDGARVDNALALPISFSSLEIPGYAGFEGVCFTNFFIFLLFWKDTNLIYESENLNLTNLNFRYIY
jgi:hypothetical protein